jgi:hypothetical protein
MATLLHLVSKSIMNKLYLHSHDMSSWRDNKLVGQKNSFTYFLLFIKNKVLAMCSYACIHGHNQSKLKFAGTFDKIFRLALRVIPLFNRVFI